MPRRRYSAEFQREAVALANQPGVTKAQIGRELDINPNMIARWQRELAANGSKAFLNKKTSFRRCGWATGTAYSRDADRNLRRSPAG